MRLPLEGTLLEKLRKIEALHAGTRVDGEREAARRAAERIRARLAEVRSREPDQVLVYSLSDVATGLCGSHFHRYHRDPGTHPGGRDRTGALPPVRRPQVRAG